MIVIGESKRQAMERALAGGVYDWAMGVDLSRALDAEETAEEERRMAERHRAWAAVSLTTYAPANTRARPGITARCRLKRSTR